MRVVFDVYLRMEWLDPRLLMPSDLFNNTKPYLTLSGDIAHDLHLWQPDPFLEESIRVSTVGFFRPYHGARLFRDGRLLLSQMFLITMKCSMYHNKFPFDEQSCQFLISSYFHSGQDMVFTWKGQGITANPLIPDMLPNFHFTFKQYNITVCRCNTCLNVERACLKAQMKLERRYLNYLMGSYLPATLFVGVSWASFFWPAQAIPARTVLCITSLLSIISLYANVQQIIPPTNYVRAIDIWFIFCICAVASSLFEYAIILMIREKRTTDSTTVVKVVPSIDNTISSTGPASGRPTGVATNLRWKRLEILVERTTKIVYAVIFVVFTIVYFSLLIK
ncbi:glutamate-gated chloride channel alpha-like [Homarus americanus]|uniref:glutamate-gated chloride channel alpha-like n=1 Tax=Homarus americanus TaxID=6706 RepID=UPI001C481EB3|nr:glutamate-gated chloride channel alpha-like [Homarus americanus]